MVVSQIMRGQAPKYFFPEPPLGASKPKRGVTHFVSYEMFGKLKDAAARCVLRPVDASKMRWL